jgi:hypothetical protein
MAAYAFASMITHESTKERSPSRETGPRFCISTRADRTQLDRSQHGAAQKSGYIYCVRIVILGSARRHGITDNEIRSTIEYPMWTARVVPRIPGTTPRLYIGRLVDTEPPIEVLADISDGECVAFHAMLLRQSTLAELDEQTAMTLSPQLAARQRK